MEELLETPSALAEPERESSIGLRRELVASVVQEIVDRAKHEYELAQAALLPEKLAEMREQIEEAMASEASARRQGRSGTEIKVIHPPSVSIAPAAPWPTEMDVLKSSSDDLTAKAGAPHPPPPLKLIQSRKTVADDITVVMRNSRQINHKKRHFGLYRVPSHPPLPQYKAWASVRRNVLCLEVGQRLFCTEAETGETIPASDDDEMELIEGLVDQLPDVQHPETSPKTFHIREAPENGTALSAEPALDGLAKDSTNKAIEAFLKELDDSEDSEDSSLLKTLCGRYYDLDKCDEEGYSLIHILAGCLGVSDVRALRKRIYHLRAQLKDADGEDGGTLQEERDRKQESHFYNSFCRICRAYVCRIHNYPHPLPHWGPRHSVPRPAGSAVTRELPSPEPCGPHCFRTVLIQDISKLPIDSCSSEADNDESCVLAKEQNNKHGQGCPSDLWTAWDVSMLEIGLSMYLKEYTGDAESLLAEEDMKDVYCAIATLLGTKTCVQVYKRLLPRLKKADGKNAMEETDNAASGDKEQQTNGTTDKPSAAAKPSSQRRKAKSQKRRILPVAYARLKRNVDDLWAQYEPCSCKGPCHEGCPCFGDLNFCEKFCGCDPKKCNNRFPGCRCRDERGRRCLTKNCPCMAAGRECDPDLCGGCIPTLAGAHAPGTQCNNFRLRLNQKHRVLMGRSKVQGWGAFLQSSAVKDEYIGEYCGELIDQKEADRRGRVYDHDDNSYLFNLNLKWVIDARHKGNKLRFANHSSEANCRAEIMMVDGDHRVAIFANRNIAPGEELFYDYRYAEHVAPEWAQE
jgi:hypothetical protein